MGYNEICFGLKVSFNGVKCRAGKIGTEFELLVVVTLVVVGGAGVAGVTDEGAAE